MTERLSLSLLDELEAERAVILYSIGEVDY